MVDQKEKREWDGSFEKSHYVETGNIVNDVIENGGRLLHEPTPDGYTHEIVDRGAYISEDYYFPQRVPGKKPHIHYEIRSTGEILVDGKQINAPAGGTAMMLHGRQLSRNRSFDGTILRKESWDQIQEGKKLHELGLKFESDKEKLEEQIEKVQASMLSVDDKRQLIAHLNAAIESLKEQYDREVTAEEKRVQQELMGQIETMKEAADEMERQSQDLRSVEMEASSTDASAAADAADAKQQEFEQMKEEYIEKLNRQVEQAAIQQRNIRNRRLTGRE